MVVFGGFMSYLGQDLLIKNVNKYLKKELMPSQVYLNKTGVCHGLAMVYAQHALQGKAKEAEFFKTLGLIAENQMHHETKYGFLSGHIFHFVSQVLLAFSPIRFEQSLSQSNSMETLKINQKSLSSSFDFAMAADHETWSGILADIQLQNDEVMITGSANHTVAIRKEGGRYTVYDPNYPRGTEVFNNEKELLRELHENVFDYKKGNLGLELHVIRHPEAAPRKPPYPNVAELYKKYLSKNHKSATTGSKDEFSTLQAVAKIKNTEAIKTVLTTLQPTVEELFEAAQAAVGNNNVVALTALLEALKAEQALQPARIKQLIENALVCGRWDIYSQLSKHLKDCCGKKPSPLILHAAVGGNPQIMRALLKDIPLILDERYKTFITKTMLKIGLEDEELKQKQVKKATGSVMIKALQNAMVGAILSGNTECITLLMEELNHYGQPPNEKQRLNYLMQAIRYNQQYALEALIQTAPDLSRALIQKISMDTLAIHKTELAVLMVLKDAGMPFTPEAEDIFQQKTREGFLSFKTLFQLVINYIQKIMGKEQAPYDESALVAMKKNECEETIKEIKNNFPKMEGEDVAFIRLQEENLQKKQSFEGMLQIKSELKEKVAKMEAEVGSAILIAPVTPSEVLRDEIAQITEECLQEPPAVQELSDFIQKSTSRNKLTGWINRFFSPSPAELQEKPDLCLTKNECIRSERA